MKAGLESARVYYCSHILLPYIRHVGIRQAAGYRDASTSLYAN